MFYGPLKRSTPEEQKEWRAWENWRDAYNEMQRFVNTNEENTALRETDAYKKLLENVKKALLELNSVRTPFNNADWEEGGKFWVSYK